MCRHASQGLHGVDGITHRHGCRNQFEYTWHVRPWHEKPTQEELWNHHRRNELHDLEFRARKCGGGEACGGAHQGVEKRDAKESAKRPIYLYAEPCYAHTNSDQGLHEREQAKRQRVTCNECAT